jgi:predicted nucleic acid-binding protein
VKVFLDSSALVKLYHEEDGSQKVQDILSQSVEPLFLSEIAKLEFRSAIWKKVRTGDLNEKKANAVISFFQNDSSNYQWITLETKIVVDASDLLMKHGTKGLRTLDSIQLASAMSIKDENIYCLTFDDLLKIFLQEEGLRIL